MPPVLLPRALQVSRTLKELKRLGWSISVLCVNPRSLGPAYFLDQELENYYRDDFEIFPVDSPGQNIFFRAMARFLPQLKSLPDLERLWAEQCIVKANRDFGAQDFSAVVSFAQPWSSHVVGLHLSRSLNLPWIAHFSDPWTDSPYNKPSLGTAPIVKKMEEEIVREAEGLVFINSYTMERVMKKYPEEWREKAMVIPHGFDTALLKPIDPSLTKRVGLTITHVGQFYADRMPWFFFEALSTLKSKNMRAFNELRVVFTGRIDEKVRQRAERMGLSSIVSFEKVKPYFQAAKTMREADVLLLIESLGSNLFLPSKLVEYLAAKKPILGLVPSPGPSADLLRRLSFPLVDPTDKNAIAQTLVELIDKKKKRKLSVGPSFNAIVADYDIKATTRTFQNLLTGII